MGKELQTLFEEGGCENLVITTKEGKKKSYKPSRMIKLFFFLISLLKFCYLHQILCSPKLMINNIDDKSNIFRLMNYKVIFLSYIIGSLC